LIEHLVEFPGVLKVLQHILNHPRRDVFAKVGRAEKASGGSAKFTPPSGSRFARDQFVKGGEFFVLLGGRPSGRWLPG
jgi:ethanolamine utilization microcompartment shell protein EutS